MRYYKNKPRKANALIVSIAALAILSSIGVSFCLMMSVEGKATKNYKDGLDASAIASIGMDIAVNKLRSDYSKDPTTVSKDWVYVYPTTTPIPTLSEVSLQGDPADDNDIRNKRKPSFPAVVLPTDITDPVKGRKVSGRMMKWVEDQTTGDMSFETDYQRAYTLKIFDTASQINLNSMINIEDTTKSSYAEAHMGLVLNTLSTYVSAATGYQSAATNGTNRSPLHNAGKDIIKKRNTIGGFISKNDLMGTYYDESGNQVKITKEDIAVIWDYLTVHPTVPEMRADTSINKPELAICRNIRPDDYSDYETYQKDYRSPVNINTASRPVLIALVLGLCNTVNKAKGTEIGTDETIKFVDNLIAQREIKFFHNLDSFYNFVLKQYADDPADTTDGAFPGNITKIYTILANFDTNTTLRRLNPDAPCFQPINKTDLYHWSTEFCFFPSGAFEITSLGQIFDDYGNVIMARQQYAVVQIFDVAGYSTQFDFEGGSSSQFYDTTDINNRINLLKDGEAIEKGLHAFSFGNNLQQKNLSETQVLAQASDVTGYLMPLGYDLPIHADAIDSNYRFRADFNGTLDGTFYGTTIANEGTKTANLATPKAPNCEATYTSFGDLATDGVVSSQNNNITKGRTLAYKSRSTTNLSESHDTQIMPPLWTTATTPGHSCNKGTIVFWFKIGRNWIDGDNEWRTVFFSNTHYKDTTNTSLICGLQREIQMNVRGRAENGYQIDNKYPLLRTVSFRIRFKFYSYNGSTPTRPGVIPTSYTKYEIVRIFAPGTTESSCYGIHAQEWYHLALRWENGLSLNFAGREFALHGMFYYIDANGQEATTTLVGTQAGYQDAPSFVSVPDPPTSLNNDEFYALDHKAGSTTYFQQRETNLFYVGNSGLSPKSPDITIDDFRISNDITAMNDISAWKPSRFPTPENVGTTDDPYYCLGSFQGRFKGKCAGDARFIYWNVRAWGSLILHPKPVSTPSNTISNIEPKVYDKLWDLMTEKTPKGRNFKDFLEKPMDFALGVQKDPLLGIQWKFMTIDESMVDKPFQFPSWTKFGCKTKGKGNFVWLWCLTTNWATATEHVDKKGNISWKIKELWKQPDDTTIFFHEKSTTTGDWMEWTKATNNGKAWTMAEILVDWVKKMHAKNALPSQYATPELFIASLGKVTLGEEETPEDTSGYYNYYTSTGYAPGQSGQPIALDTQHELVYSIRFPTETPQSNVNLNKPIFQCPIVDDLILIYQAEKPVYLEFSDASIVP